MKMLFSHPYPLLQKVQVRQCNALKFLEKIALQKGQKAKKKDIFDNTIKAQPN